MAPVVVARTTSFTDPPRAFFTDLTSTRSISVQSNLTVWARFQDSVESGSKASANRTAAT